jgi:hypothetical protein
MYHINNLNNVQSVDELLQEYKLKNKNIVDLLEKNPDELVKNNWLYIDNTCQMQMGKYDNDLTSDFMCLNCQQVEHFVSLDEYEIGAPFAFKDIMTETKLDSTYLRWVAEDKIKGDNFSIKILVTLYLDKVFSSKKLPHAIKLHNSFICNHSGYTLYTLPNVNQEVCNFECLLQIDTKCIYGILLQLIVIFKELDKCCLGNPSIDAFLFDHKACSYTYEKKTIKCPYTIILSDLAKTSVTINNILFLPEYNYIHNIINHNFNKCVDYKTSKDTQNTYTINTECFNEYFDNIKYKFPYIDFYLTLLSMARYEVFYNYVKNNKECQMLWAAIWNNQQDVIDKKIMEQLEDMEDLKEGDQENLGADDISILQGLELYVNPISHIFTQL